MATATRPGRGLPKPKRLTKRQREFGYFVSGGVVGGSPQVELLPEGRKVRLLADFVYVPPKGRVWPAPKGSIVDGSSIPAILWTVATSPWVGLHRNASIVHDVFCVSRARAAQTTHDMYFYACRAAGMSYKNAYLMWKAIDVGGPRWKKNKTDVLPKVNSSTTY